MPTRTISLLALAFALAACDCGGGGTSRSGGELSVQETSLAFGDACARPTDADVHVDSVTKTVHLSNVGNALLYLNGFSVQPAAAAQVFTFDPATVPASLEAGGSAEVALTFTPAASGAIAGELRILAEEGSPEVVVALSGAGKPEPIHPQLTLSCRDDLNAKWKGADGCEHEKDPQLGVEPNLWFDDTGAGSTREMKLTLKNGGCPPLEVKDLAVATTTDPALGYFAPGDGTATSFTVPGGGAKDVVVRFVPFTDQMPEGGLLTGELSFTTNDHRLYKDSVRIPLKGIGVQAELEVSPMTCDFSQRAAPCDGVFTLRNNTSVGFAIHGVSLETPNPMFAIGLAPQAGLMLGAGEQVQVRVDYTPGLERVQTNLLVDWARGQAVARVFGGSPPVADVTPMVLDFGQDLAPATDFYRPVTLTNTSRWSQQLKLKITSIAVRGSAMGFDLPASPPDPIACPPAPAIGTEIADGASLKACVRFRSPGAGASYSDELVIGTNDPASPQTTVTLVASSTCNLPPVAEISVPLGTSCPCAEGECREGSCHTINTANVALGSGSVELSGELSRDLKPNESGVCDVPDRAAVDAWEWSLDGKPLNSTATLSQSGKGTASRTRLTFDLEGTYRVKLTAYDDTGLPSTPVTFNVYVAP